MTRFFVDRPIFATVISVVFVLAGGVAVFTFAYVRKLRIEEQLLGEEFGTQWQEYRRRSWALVPGVF